MKTIQWKAQNTLTLGQTKQTNSGGRVTNEKHEQRGMNKVHEQGGHRHIKGGGGEKGKNTHNFF